MNIGQVGHTAAHRIGSAATTARAAIGSFATTVGQGIAHLAGAVTHAAGSLFSRSSATGTSRTGQGPLSMDEALDSAFPFWVARSGTAPIPPSAGTTPASAGRSPADAAVDAVTAQFGEVTLLDCGLSSGALKRALTDRHFMSNREEGVAQTRTDLADRKGSDADKAIHRANQEAAEHQLAAAKALVDCARSHDPATGGFDPGKLAAFRSAQSALADARASLAETVDQYRAHREQVYTPVIRDQLGAGFGTRFTPEELDVAAQALHDSVIRDQDHVLQYYPTDQVNVTANVARMMENARRHLPEDAAAGPGGAAASPEFQRVADLVFAARGAQVNDIGNVNFDVQGLSARATHEVIAAAAAKVTGLA